MDSFYENKIFEYLKNKKISLIGFGKSNIAVAEMLSKFGLDFEIRDKNCQCKSAENTKKFDKKCIFGENYLKNLSCDIIFLSPGVRPDLPEISLAVKNGAICSSEIDFFLKFCPTKGVFAVTGSDGKSTTTSLIYELLKRSGKNVIIGGNIGIPLISQINQASRDSYVVLELSSFQLMSLQIKPKVAIITNISENHLDWHKNFEEYVESKLKIFQIQDENDTLILNFDDKFSRKISKSVKSKIKYFSVKSEVKEGCCLDNQGNIVFLCKNYISKIINKNDIRIPGEHNIANYMAAISACVDFVSKNDMIWVAKNFKGLNHRIEFVRNINGVKFYDDSIASTPNRVVNGALSVFKKNVILIAGGYDKHLDFKNFAEVVCNKVKILLLIGQTSGKIKSCVLRSKCDKKPEIFEVKSMKEAVSLAYENSQRGDIILLSPACASFGMYKNFEERGNNFKYCVNELKQLS